MVRASVDLFYFGLLATALASAAYAAVTINRALALAGHERTFAIPRTFPGRLTGQQLARWSTWGAVILLGSAVAARAIATHRPPYANMWEYFLVLAFAIVTAYAVLDAFRGWGRMGVVVLPIALGVLVTADVLFSHRVEPLVPALRNNWLLAIHVASMITAYGFMALAFGAAVVYLVQRPEQRHVWLPAADEADRLGNMAIMIGFPILGLGIALGAWWGNIAWGRYWGWDPKETTALISWLIYAGYMHARALRNWRGSRAAMLSILGFASIVFNIFVVNFVISGLHSYAGG